MKSKQTRIFLLVVAITAALAGTFATLASTNSHTDAQSALARISAQGQVVTLPATDNRTKNLLTTGVTSVERISTIGQTAFYRVRKPGESCFGVGHAGASWPFGVIACDPADQFPTPDNPILDMSIVGADTGQSPHLLRIQGIATDVVASIDVLNSSGQVIGHVPLKNNTFDLDNLPPDAAEFAAKDAQGHELLRH